MKECCITFDVDLTDYFSNAGTDELEMSFDGVKAILSKYPDVKTTWFIRIDSQIEKLYNIPDYIFIRHKDKLNWLRSNGHALGWHYHAYRQVDNEWRQTTDEETICAELEKYAPFAKKYDLTIARMGWGFHTNKTLKQLYDLGFRKDSSAIPRPKYKWDMNIRDWEKTPNRPFFPGTTDYRLEQNEKIGILEIPINTTVIKASTDTEIVKRYLNIAYKHQAFANAVNDLKELDLLVSITHPYELIPNKAQHELLSFSYHDFELNIQFLQKKNYSLINMLNISNA